MTESKPNLPAETSGTEITRFNALRHGVLSRFTVLPWEDADEYQAIVIALLAEHAPQGPTEEHLVEEIAGILWRKRRLRLAEAAAPSTCSARSATMPTRQRWPSCARTHKPGGRMSWPAIRTNCTAIRNPRLPTWRNCVASSRARCCLGSRPARRFYAGGRQPPW
jgi:hypothetical protein